jgi:CRP-like cAMP-binding protein/Fe-S-cluster-containing dehydrogenase component
MPRKFVDLNPVGVCRLCCVELGEIDKRDKKLKYNKVLVPSCMRPIEDGMHIRTRGGTVDVARKTLVELLLSDHPPDGCDRHREFGDCELEVLAESYGFQKTERDAEGRATRVQRAVAFLQRSRATVEQNKSGRAFFKDGVDHSNPMIRIDHAACIVCDRCVRACTDVKKNYVIGRVGKGYSTTIGFDLDQPMDESSCVNCGECMITCPTGAITFAGVGAQNLKCEKRPTVNELQRFEIFQGVSAAFLELALGSICIREYRKGEVLCKQGEYGSTAFYITSGDCEVFISPAGAAGESTKRSGGSAISSLLSLFSPHKNRNGGGGGGNGSIAPESIAIDASVDLKRDATRGIWVNTLGAGDLVGEMACMNFQPRSATVVASSERVVVVEMLRNVLDLLRKNRAFREKVDRNYIQKALSGHLQKVELFRDVPPEFLREMEKHAQLLRLRAGHIICGEGDLADGFYIVRTGHVKASRRGAASEVVLKYFRRGDVFGEIATLGALGRLDKSLRGADGRRTATCTTLDEVELVRFDSDTCDNLLRLFPQVAEKLTRMAETRLSESQSGRVADGAAQTAAKLEGDPRFAYFVEEGLYQSQNMLVLDLTRCTRCDECVRACADTHGGVPKMARDGIRFDKYLVTTSCRACSDPVCMVGCPVGSIRRREGLEILIEDWCIGCGLCEKNCPFGSINMLELEKHLETQVGQERATRRAEMRRASVCDLSREFDEPACVHACPHDAAIRVSGENLLRNVVFGEPLRPAARTEGGGKK